MLEELTKALGPWPILQLFFGVIVLVVGAIAAIKGLSSSSKKADAETPSDDDKKAQWIAYTQLQNIEQNSFKSVELQQRLVEAIQRLTDNIWNRKQL